MEDLPFGQGKIPQQQKLEDGTLFPTVLRAQYPSKDKDGIGSFLNAIQQHRDSLTNLLQKSGALLFRGFPVKNASDFNAIVEAFGWEEQPYLGAASRNRIVGKVYTANEAPLHQLIHAHHEMTTVRALAQQSPYLFHLFGDSSFFLFFFLMQFDEFPRKIIFFCEVAPPEGGQTAIVLSHRITQRMEEEFPELVTKLEKEGLIYSRTFPREDDPNSIFRGWQTYFQTRVKEEAESNAAKAGYKTQWLEDGSLRVFRPYAAIRTFDGGKRAWFNSIVLDHLKNPSNFGDGSQFPVDAIERCLQIIEEEWVEVNWEVGDVLILDNRLVQHARRPSKPPRRVLTALCK